MMQLRLLRYFLFLSFLFLVFTGCNDEDSPLPDPLEEAYQNDKTWYWIPKSEMISRSGITSGYGVNFNNGSSGLVIYLEGGGACFNEVTCLTNQSKFDEGDFNNRIIMGDQGNEGIYDRNSTNNPFNEWNYVYIPYSTGDVHSGNNPETKRVGFNNVTIILDDIAPFFLTKGVDEVFLCGASAGGYGALINYDQVARSFPDINISMLVDSSPVFFDPDIYPDCLNERFETVFDIQFPPDFQAFTEDTYPYQTQGIYDYMSNKYPEAQFGLFSYYKDAVISFFFGFGLNECADEINPIDGEVFKEGLFEISEAMDDYGNWKVYYETGTSHTILFSEEFEMTSVSDVPFTTWLDRLNRKNAENVMR